MTAVQVYEQYIKLLTIEEKLAILRLIIVDVVPDPMLIADMENAAKG